MKNNILILSFFLLFSCSDFYQPAVVSARKEATQIGLEIMKNGGNAYDAMIATHLALAVVHPTAGNIGGGGFALEVNSLLVQSKIKIDGYIALEQNNEFPMAYFGNDEFLKNEEENYIHKK